MLLDRYYRNAHLEHASDSFLEVHPNMEELVIEATVEKALLVKRGRFTNSL